MLNLFLTGINFTNVHFALDFTRTDPKSAKMTEGLTVIFALLGYAHLKALSKLLVKLISRQHCIYSTVTRALNSSGGKAIKKNFFSDEIHRKMALLNNQIKTFFNQLQK